MTTENKAVIESFKNNQSKGNDANANKYLSFVLGKEEYSVEILKVREIIGIIDVTPLPQTPDYIKGVINLRGKIIPVVELRTRFGIESVEYTDATCIIVVEVESTDGEQLHMGVIVDTVSEVLSIGANDLEPAPKFATAVNTDYILGIGKVKGKTIILLDINKVLSAAEISAISTKAENAEVSQAA
ncbi:MAG: chemotaxis protein CheW [Phycisphaerales bacterium]